MTNNTFPDDVVEAVARAICAEGDRDPDAISYQTVEPGVQEPRGPMWMHFECEARAALSAIAPYIAQREAAALERAAKTAESLDICALEGCNALGIATAIRALKPK